MAKIQKKGQGLSINTIIISIIALVVLVVLVAIFTGRLGAFSKGLSETTTCDVICKARGYGGGTSNGDPTNNILLTGARDSNGNQCYCAP